MKPQFLGHYAIGTLVKIKPITQVTFFDPLNLAWTKELHGYYAGQVWIVEKNHFPENMGTPTINRYDKDGKHLGWMEASFANFDLAYIQYEDVPEMRLP